ncbi:MAG: cobyric acid synthase, partial [Lachnospiraceae bacterium]|nr:cobyric acid synthase [Lachnospiraceae bacterium]
MNRNLMIQGTMSGVGKSLITAGMCRMLKQDGLHPAPFKSQNMALNSYVTKDGLEIGRAQAMQAFAAGLTPTVEMNPVLLKPTGDTGSQVIVNGLPVGNMTAREYFEYKRSLMPDIGKAFSSLAEQYDPIIIEGAGSPAEINLKDHDIVNMGLAEIVDAQVFLVGDVDRGGVFAQLVGTLMLLSYKERSRVRGLIINKFRGDRSLLDPGIAALEKKCGIPVIGVIPYLSDLMLEDEDSLTERFDPRRKSDASITIAVVRLPRISNFSDFDPFEQTPAVSVVYTADPDRLAKADLIVIPGTKNTIEDMRFMNEMHLSERIKELSGAIPIIGICGGLQILGGSIADPEGAESGGSIEGLGLLPYDTVMQEEKHLAQREGTIEPGLPGIFASLSGRHFTGYEIHLGESVSRDDPSAHFPVLTGTDRDV